MPRGPRGAGGGRVRRGARRPQSCPFPASLTPSLVPNSGLVGGCGDPASKQPPIWAGSQICPFWAGSQVCPFWAGSKTSHSGRVLKLPIWAGSQVCPLKNSPSGRGLKSAHFGRGHATADFGGPKTAIFGRVPQLPKLGRVPGSAQGPRPGVVGPRPRERQGAPSARPCQKAGLKLGPARRPRTRGGVLARGGP